MNYSDLKLSKRLGVIVVALAVGSVLGALAACSSDGGNASPSTPIITTGGSGGAAGTSNNTAGSSSGGGAGHGGEVREAAGCFLGVEHRQGPMLRRHEVGRSVNRRANPLIGSTATEVAVHRFIDLGIGRLRVLREERRGRHDLSALAVAALGNLQLDPRPLNRGAAVG